MPPAITGMRLYNGAGRRLYLNAAERTRFIAAARNATPTTAALCLCLVYSGCRNSEALALRPSDVQGEAGVLSIHTLKKRRAGHMRELPIPPELATLLAELGIDNHRFWQIDRSTGWRRVKAVMTAAGIIGPQAMPKGLRHGFAVHAILNNVPPMIVQKWLGHADLRTTAIYTQICGAEERTLAQRLWEL